MEKTWKFVRNKRVDNVTKKTNHVQFATEMDARQYGFKCYNSIKQGRPIPQPQNNIKQRNVYIGKTGELDAFLNAAMKKLPKITKRTVDTLLMRCEKAKMKLAKKAKEQIKTRLRKLCPDKCVGF